MKRKNIIIDLILGLLLIFLIVLIKCNKTSDFDMAIYNFLAQFISPPATTFWRLITFFGSTIFITSLTIIFLLSWCKNRRGVKFLIIISSAIAISTILKIIIARERPEVLKLVIENTKSFPSGHTIAITTLCGYLIYCLEKEWGKLKPFYRRMLQIILAIIPLLVMISRIYLGAHFATDIIGGILIAFIVLNTTIPLLEKKL